MRRLRTVVWTACLVAMGLVLSAPPAWAQCAT
jgi:hypothetical protein